MFTEKSFDAGEVTLRYDEGPDNGPPMVLLHGLTGMRQSWQVNMAPAFGQSWHQYLIDLRGHGQSGRAPEPSRYCLADYAGDVVAFLRSELDEPAVVVGHSLGALTSIKIGSAVADRIRALVLLDPPLFNRNQPTASLPGAYDWFSFVYDTVHKNPAFDEVVAACRARDPQADESLIQMTAARISRVAPGTVRAALDDTLLAGIDLAAALQKYACPALLVYGDWDKGAAVREADVDFVRENLPQVQTARVDGGHLFPWEMWDETRPPIERFLASV